MGTHDPKDIDEEVNSSWKLVSHLVTSIIYLVSLVIRGITFLKKLATRIPNPSFWAEFSNNLSIFPPFPRLLLIL